jgi:hemoglobin
MQTAWLKWLGTLTAGLWIAGFLGVGSAVAQNTKPTPPPIDKGLVDQHLNEFLRDVINQGAGLYNNGDAQGCYNLFRSALVSAWYMLDQHPDLRREINAALGRADGQTAVADRAYTLRAALDATRTGLATAVPKKGTEAAAPVRPVAPVQTTLWQQLGGQAGVRKVVDDFVTLAGNDPKVDFTRGGKYLRKPEEMANFKQQMVDLISENTGGPLKYNGRPLRPAHQDMGITNDQFDALVADLRKALVQNGYPTTDADALVRIVEGTRGQIVQSKGTEATKPTKPAEPSKPADTKPAPTSPKPADTKPAPASPGTNPKPEIKKPDHSSLEVEFPLKKPLTEPKFGPDDGLPFRAPGLGLKSPESSRPSPGKTTAEKKPADKTAGKNDEKPARDTVDIKGKVTYKGKPLADATIIFVPKEDSVKTRKKLALTTREGVYAIRDIQPGEYNIMVAPPKEVSLPEKYKDAQTSGLKARVTHDDKTFDLNLQ